MRMVNSMAVYLGVSIIFIFICMMGFIKLCQISTSMHHIEEVMDELQIVVDHIDDQIVDSDDYE